MSVATQTPATCANIALHNLYPGQIDLLVSNLPAPHDAELTGFCQISGPNLGRNSSGLSRVCSVREARSDEMLVQPRSPCRPAPSVLRSPRVSRRSAP